MAQSNSAELHNAVHNLNQALAASDIERLRAAAAQMAQIAPQSFMATIASAEVSRRSGQADEAVATCSRHILGPSTEDQRQAAGSSTIDLYTACLAFLAKSTAIGRECVPIIQLLGMCAEECGLLSANAEAICASLLQARKRLGGLHGVCIPNLFTAIAVTRQSTEPWLRQAFHQIVLPWMEAASEDQSMDELLLVEDLLYSEVVRMREQGEWFRSFVPKWLPTISEAAKEYNLTSSAPAGHSSTTPRKVAFFMHRASTLAHAMRIMDAVGLVPDELAGKYQYTVFIWRGRDATLHEAIERSGASIQYLDENASHWETLKQLQAALSEQGFVACIWVSLITMMAAAFSMRVAPLQLWWSMKYHITPPDGTDVCIALDNFLPGKSLDGVWWRTIPGSIQHQSNPSSDVTAANIRQAFPPNTIVLGTLGREEKLIGADYLNAICQVLSACPQTIFLYTGRAQRYEIVNTFRQSGLEHRTRFIGWVDTEVYARVIDVFLDSFPFPCGQTIAQAMSAGRGVVMYESADSLETGLPGSISPVLRHSAPCEEALRKELTTVFTHQTTGDLYLCAEDPKEYTDMAIRLVRDSAFRNLCATANQQFIQKFMSDPGRTSRQLVTLLDELFAQKA